MYYFEWREICLLLFSIMIFYYLFFLEKKIQFLLLFNIFLTIFAVIFLFSSKTYYDDT